MNMSTNTVLFSAFTGMLVFGIGLTLYARFVLAARPRPRRRHRHA